jgi:hypothetical protein
MIVMTTDKATKTIVNKMYFPSNGRASEVDGMISDIRRKNMVWERRMLMQRAIFSPESAGK